MLFWSDTPRPFPRSHLVRSYFQTKCLLWQEEEEKKQERIYLFCYYYYLIYTTVEKFGVRKSWSQCEQSRTFFNMNFREIKISTNIFNISNKSKPPNQHTVELFLKNKSLQKQITAVIMHSKWKNRYKYCDVYIWLPCTDFQFVFLCFSSYFCVQNDIPLSRCLS